MTKEPIDDPDFGRLTYDGDDWNGEVEVYPGYRSSVRLSEEDDSREPTVELEAARQILHRVRRGELDLRRAAAAKYLELYEAWNEGSSIDEATFVSRMTLKSVMFTFGFGADFFFDEDDMFAGHFIIVTVGNDGKIASVALGG